MQISKQTFFSLLSLSLAITFSACDGKEKKNNEIPPEKSAEDESGDESDGDDDGATDDDDDTPVVVDMPPSNECGKMCSLFDQEACGPDEMCTSWQCAPEATAWDQSICAPIGTNKKVKSVSMVG